MDQVRYLSNYSTGYLGFEICKALEPQAEVIAVVGPCEAPFEKLKNVTVIKVETVDEMYHAVMEVCSKQKPSFAVLAAAVLDFAPRKIKAGKVSSDKTWTIDLIPTPKIIDEMTQKFPKIKKVAFKLEWEMTSLKAIKQFAIRNMKQKSADALCLNFLSQIEGKSHPAYLFSRDGKFKKTNTKKEIATWIKNYISSSD